MEILGKNGQVSQRQDTEVFFNKSKIAIPKPLGRSLLLSTSTGCIANYFKSKYQK